MTVDSQSSWWEVGGAILDLWQYVYYQKSTWIQNMINLICYFVPNAIKWQRSMAFPKLGWWMSPWGLLKVSDQKRMIQRVEKLKSYRTWKLKLALQQNMIWQTSDNVYINFRNSKCMCQMFNSVLKMFLKAMNFSVKWKNFWWIWRWDNLIVREWDRYLGHKKNNCMFPVSRLT